MIEIYDHQLACHVVMTDEYAWLFLYAVFSINTWDCSQQYSGVPSYVGYMTSHTRAEVENTLIANRHRTVADITYISRSLVLQRKIQFGQSGAPVLFRSIFATRHQQQ